MPEPSVVIVGRRSSWGTCLPSTQPDGVRLRWLERSPGARPAGGDALDAATLAGALDRESPDAAGLVIALDPEPGDAAAIAAVGARSAAWLPCRRRGLDELALERFDVVLTASLDAARAVGPAARIEPLPVDDALFAPVGEPAVPVRALFDGPASKRRDALLNPAKHDFDLLHLAGGAGSARLADLQARCAVAVDLAEEDGLPGRDRIGTALAAGLLVLAERPLDRPGVEPGVELATFEGPWELCELLGEVGRNPDAFRSTRIRGRLAAEPLRASVAWPRLVTSLLPAGGDGDRG